MPSTFEPLIYTNNPQESFFFSNQKQQLNARAIRPEQNQFVEKINQPNNQQFFVTSQPLFKEKLLLTPLISPPSSVFSQTSNFQQILPHSPNTGHYPALRFPGLMSQNILLPKETKSYSLPNAEYSRNEEVFSSAEVKIDPRQRQLFNRLENSKYAQKIKLPTENSHHFEEKVIDKILTHLPQLAATVLKMSNSGNTEKTQYYSTTPNTDFKPSAPKFTESYYSKNSAKIDGVASIVNELPSLSI